MWSEIRNQKSNKHDLGRSYLTIPEKATGGTFIQNIGSNSKSMSSISGVTLATLAVISDSSSSSSSEFSLKKDIIFVIDMKNLIKIGCLFDPFFSGDSPISNDPTKS
jgi:hypothetical protein